MIVDSSALVAIQLREPGFDALIDKITAAPVAFVGAPTLCEAVIVLTGRTGDNAGIKLEGLLRRMGVAVVPFTEAHYEAAILAFRKFGKGRNAAALNFGDCMAYAVASVSGLPLLYTGKDFSRTDIEAA